MKNLFCVLEYARTSSVATVQRRFRAQFALMRWPSRTPHITISDFSFVGICKGHCFCTSSPANLQELRDRITAAVALIDRDILTRVWNELDYRLVVCRISQGGHIEHL